MLTAQAWSWLMPMLVKEPEGGLRMLVPLLPQQSIPPAVLMEQPVSPAQLTSVKVPDGGLVFPELPDPQHANAPVVPIPQEKKSPEETAVKVPAGGDA